MKKRRTLIPTIPDKVIVRVSTGLHNDGISETGEVNMSPQEVAKSVVRAVLEGMPPPAIQGLISVAALWLATEGKDGTAMLKRARRCDCLFQVTVSEDAIDAMLEKGDLDGPQVWLRIIRVIEEVLQRQPKAGEVQH